MDGFISPTVLSGLVSVAVQMVATVNVLFFGVSTFPLSLEAL